MFTAPFALSFFHLQNEALNDKGPLKILEKPFKNPVISWLGEG